MRVPLGVVGIIYEARPNVTVDGVLRRKCLIVEGWIGLLNVAVAIIGDAAASASCRKAYS